MTTVDNKLLARRFFDEVFNRLDRAAAAEIIAADFVAHHPNFGEIRGPERAIGVVAGLRASFPDLRYAVDDLVAEGDKVVARWTARGTQQGEFQGLPPTGKPVVVTGIDIFRVANGKLAETWINSDILGMLQQLGMVPAPGSH